MAGALTAARRLLRLAPADAGPAGVPANAAALFLAFVLPRGCTVAAAIVAARVLGPEGFGAYATAGALAVLASIIATLGMQPLLVREISRDPGQAPALVGAAHAVKVLTVGLMAATLVLGTVLSGLPDRLALPALLLGASYGIGAFVENLAAYFQGIERMYVWTQASVLDGLIAGCGGIVLVVATGDLLAFCAAPLLGKVASLAWLLAASPPAVRQPPRPRLELALGMVRQLAPFAVAFIATTIYYRADILLLARLRDQAEVGAYSAARRFLDVGQAVTMAGAGAVYPRLARSAAGREPRIRTGLELTLLAAVPAAGLLFLLRQPLVQVLYGARYADSLPVLAILAPALAPLVLNMFCLAALTAAGAAWTAARLWLGAAALNICLNLLLVPAHGAVGAAAAAVASETALAFAFLVAHARRGVTLAPASIRGAAAAAILAFAAAWLAPGLIAAGVYLVVVVLAYRLAGSLPSSSPRWPRARAPEAA